MQVTIRNYNVAGRMPIFTRENRDLVRSGVKTQTRRVMKKQLSVEELLKLFPSNGGWDKGWKTPYGKPGDIRVMPEPLYNNTGFAVYGDDYVWVKQSSLYTQWQWKVNTLSSLFMPVEYGRTLVRYTRLWVERLQDISEADAVAEGVESIDTERFEHDYRICSKCGGTRLHNGVGPNLGVIFDIDCTECDTHKKRFKYLWDSLNGKTHPWDSNPWVWCIEWESLPFVEAAE